MNKSKFLTLATTAAVIATTAGTFAAWDTLSGTAEGTITVENTSIVVEAKNISTWNTTNQVEGTEITYTGDAVFNVAGKEKLSNIVLTPKLADESGQEIAIDKATVSVAPITTIVEGANTSLVTVTVKDENLVGKTLKVSVEAVATPVTN